ncbi:hypothetical protein [Streptomyces sp. NPDC002889]|uniref:hypothetical protein n=1 Tax=Streptomyces sp. NPDC002889 TaxID=3364669 RepID=UPI00368490D1
MSGYASSGTAVQEVCTSSVEHDWRFAELVARSYLQPELALRYALEPRNVLAEFGIPVAPGSVIPALPADTDTEVTITNLSTADVGDGFTVHGVQPCFCTTRQDLVPAPAAQGAGAGRV